MGTRTRVVTGLLVAATTALGLVPVSAATTTTVAPTAEAWYQPNPFCTTPAGCGTGTVPGAPAAVSPYPAGTLHVAVSGGRETARTYLTLPAGGLDGATAARLTVPVDADPASGTVSPETATLQVCTTSTAVEPTEGSLAQPPAADCDRSATVSYVATPEPRLEADLRSLLEGASGAVTLVLLPDASTLAPGDAWHVAFSAQSRTGGGAPVPVPPVPAPGAATAPAPASVEVTQPDVAAPAAPELPAAPVEAPPAAELPAVDVDVVAAPFDPVAAELGEAPLPSVSEPLPAEESAVVAAPDLAVVPVQPVAFPQTVRVGYAYPGVWLLPLVLLVAVPMVGRALTRDLAPVRG